MRKFKDAGAVVKVAGVQSYGLRKLPEQQAKRLKQASTETCVHAACT